MQFHSIKKKWRWMDLRSRLRFRSTSTLRHQLSIPRHSILNPSFRDISSMTVYMLEYSLSHQSVSHVKFYPRCSEASPAYLRQFKLTTPQLQRWTQLAALFLEANQIVSLFIIQRSRDQCMAYTFNIYRLKHHLLKINDGDDACEWRFKGI